MHPFVNLPALSVLALPQSTGCCDHGKGTLCDFFGTFHLHPHLVHYMFHIFHIESTWVHSRIEMFAALAELTQQPGMPAATDLSRW